MSGATKKRTKPVASADTAIRKDAGARKRRDADESKPGDSDAEPDDDMKGDDSGDEYDGRKASRTPKRRSRPATDTAADASGLRRSARSTREVRGMSSAAASPARQGKPGPEDDHDRDEVKMRNNPRLGERIHDPSVLTRP